MRLRRGVWIVAILTVIAIIAVAAMPMVASTRIVRDRIAQELSVLTGYRVVFDSGPDLSIWPVVTAKLGDVSLMSWGDESARPVFQAEEIEVDLSALAALRGRIVFSRIALVRPVIRVTPAGRLIYEPSPTSAGRIGYAIDTARETLAADRASPDFSSLPNDPLGKVELRDGRILEVASGSETEIVTGISGSVDWPSLNGPAVATLSGIWRGEAASLLVTAPQPLVLMAGGQGELAIAARSSPVEASFNGVARFDGDGFFDGAVKFSTPSLRRLLEWSRGPLAFATPARAVTATSSVNGSRSRMKFDSAELTIDGSRGMGALELTVQDAAPRVSGTLAFGELDVGALLTALTPLRASGGAAPGEAQPASGGRTVDLDLRISTSRARAGPIDLLNVAATAQIRDGLAVLDISDATAFGGTVQAGIRVDRTWRSNAVEIRLLGTDVDAAAVAAAVGMTRLAPQARGSISVDLKGTGDDWEAATRSAGGTVAMKLGKGALAGLDLGGFLARIEEGKFFALADAGSGSIAFDGVDVQASVVGGVASLDRAEMLTPDRAIRLGGLVPYVGRGLALSGTVSDRVREGEPQPAGPTAQFFVGGSWEEPFVSPVLSGWTTE